LAPQECRLELTAGQGDFASASNPISIDFLVESVLRLLKLPTHSISMTGGEPLCQPNAVKHIASKVDLPVFLETNGTLPDALSDVIGAVDIIAMDIKLPSSCGGRSFWEEHAEFLSIAAKKEVFVKIVLTPEMGDGEFFRALKLIYDISPNIPTILQPATGGDGRCAVAASFAMNKQMIALSLLKDVRVIPQTHKMLGQL
jgi:organic radical activating enzyme